MQNANQRLGRRLRRNHGQGRDGRVHNVHSRLYSLKNGCHGHAAGVVGMEMDGHLDSRFELPHQFVGHVGRQQSGHVFDTDGIGPHVLHHAAHLDKGIHIVHRTDGIAEGHLSQGTLSFDHFQRPPHIAHIVQRIKDAKYIDTILVGANDKAIQYIIGIVFVAYNVLPPQQHLKRRVGHHCLELAYALPGVLVEETHGGIKGRSSPHLHRPKAYLVQLFRDGHGRRPDHVIGAHPRGQQALVRIAQNGITDLNRFFAHTDCLLLGE